MFWMDASCDAGVMYPVTLCDVLTHPCRTQEVKKFFNVVPHIFWSLCPMMTSGMVLGHIIRVIIGAFFPVYFELLLSLTIPEPVVPHVPSFRSILVNIAVYEPRSCGDVIFKGCWWLWVIERP